VYSKLFLIQLGSKAVCQKKPDVLRNWSKLTKLSSVPQFDSLGVSFQMNICDFNILNLFIAFYNLNFFRGTLVVMQLDFILFF